MDELIFEWDPVKAELNYTKHYNEFVKQHRKRSWFKVQAADKK